MLQTWTTTLSHHPREEIRALAKSCHISIFLLQYRTDISPQESPLMALDLVLAWGGSKADLQHAGKTSERAQQHKNARLVARHINFRASRQGDVSIFCKILNCTWSSPVRVSSRGYECHQAIQAAFSSLNEHMHRVHQLPQVNHGAFAPAYQMGGS